MAKRGGRRGPNGRNGLPPQDGRPASWVVDRIVEHATYLERLKNGEGRGARAPMMAAAKRVRSIVAELLEEVAGTARPWESVAHANAVVRIAQELRAAAGVVHGQASDLVLRAARLEAEWQGVLLAKSLPVQFDFARVPEAQLAALVRRPVDGKPLADWTDGIAQFGLNGAKEALNRGLTRGAPIGEIAAEIRSVLDVSTRAAETITRTAVTHASSGARQEFAEQNADIIVGWRFVATLDSRTSKSCAAADGRVFRVGEGPMPPLHPNCRSTSQLLTRTPEELLNGTRKPVTLDYLRQAGDRAARGERPSLEERPDGTADTGSRRASTRYGAWLRDQPAATQDRVLGRTLGLAFRAGKAEIEDFVGADYRPLTIPEIEARLDESLR